MSLVVRVNGRDCLLKFETDLSFLGFAILLFGGFGIFRMGILFFQFLNNRKLNRLKTLSKKEPEEERPHPLICKEVEQGSDSSSSSMSLSKFKLNLKSLHFPHRLLPNKFIAKSNPLSSITKDCGESGASETSSETAKEQRVNTSNVENTKRMFISPSVKVQTFLLMSQ